MIAGEDKKEAGLLSFIMTFVEKIFKKTWEKFSREIKKICGFLKIYPNTPHV